MNPFKIEKLGDLVFNSPLETAKWDNEALLQRPIVTLEQGQEDQLITTTELFTHLQRAGPRKKLFFEPKKVIAGIVCCGGLCPGINNVIRSLVQCLIYRYHVAKVYGFQYGYEGLNPEVGRPPRDLGIGDVRDIHHFGGCVLGTSRGPQDTIVMVDYLISLGVNMLFTIGGDGTLKGAQHISDECKRRNVPISVIGVPKTIDNDILFVEKTFGFETAVQQAQSSIAAAHEEARSHRNGIGIVKLMGRDSGFIGLHASLASSDVNILLIPEKPFSIEKLCDLVKDRLNQRSHVLIVVAEGAGQELLLCKSSGKDLSGNKVLGDIGRFLQDEIGNYLKKEKIPFTIKYIDPSYSIRSSPANAQDAVFTVTLAQMAVHAAMAGKTNLIVGVSQNTFVHIPISKAVESRKKVPIDGSLYQILLDNTGMPFNLE